MSGRREAAAAVIPIRQRSQFGCMAASMSMALKSLGIDADEDTVNKVMGAKPLRGASWEDALACAQYFGCRATLHAPCTMEQLRTWTDAGSPVLIGWNPEGRPWSHASCVFDVGESIVKVADPNCPDPDQTVREVPVREFLEKWKEDRGDYLVRRPAMRIVREIDAAGVPINKVEADVVRTAGKKERGAIKDRAMARRLKMGPFRPEEVNDTVPEMGSARREILKEQGMAGLPGAGMGSGFHKDKSQYDRKRDRSIERDAARLAADIPADVERYVQEGEDRGYDEEKAWGIAWPRYCKYENPGSDHCQMSPSEYGRKATENMSIWDGYRAAGKSIEKGWKGKSYNKGKGHPDDPTIQDHKEKARDKTDNKEERRDRAKGDDPQKEAA